MLWGTGIWGISRWGVSVARYKQIRIPWSKPIVFNQMTLSVTGDAIPGFQIGDLFMRYQVLGYMV
jgi:hypothetical protein